MSDDFDVDDFLKWIIWNNNSTKQYKEILRSFKLGNTKNIEETVDKSINNLKIWKKRFVIYWEPQSWKTYMMIALTAKLIDEWYDKIIILINDNLQLLWQNLERFQRSKLKPIPQDIDSCIWEDLSKKSRFIIFTKKNASNLKNIYNITKRVKDIIIIDDEADYASPNSKINKEDVTKISELIIKILWEAGSYIWVTATPARLDLNLTFKNAIEDWVGFSPYEWYCWDKIFFPNYRRSTKDNYELKYGLNLFKDDANYKDELKMAIFNFIVNVSYLNMFKNAEEKNYCMLVHTSHKTEHHYDDAKNINDIFFILKNEKHPKFKKYIEQIVDIIKKKIEWLTNNEISKMLNYIIQEVDWWLVKIINSNEKNKEDYIKKLTDPISPFTIAIWWNILSRWLTFNNLLSMFFLRTTKSGKLQQDTYIQMARMFWNRWKDLEYFELNIPESLFWGWREQFDLHRLSFSFLRNWITPKWFYSEKSNPTSWGAIDKKNTSTENEYIDEKWSISIDVRNNEIYSEKFDFSSIKNFVNHETKIDDKNAINLLNKLNTVPELNWFIKSILENFNLKEWIMFHPTLSIEWQTKVPIELLMEIRTKWEWLLPNLVKPNPNVRIHCRIYHYKEWKARLYVYFKERENLIKWWRNIKSISRK